MIIPLPYYIFHWIKFTIMAIATGLVCGMFIYAPIGVPTGGILGVLLGQVAVFSYFFGKRRGKFEFQYIEYQRKTEIMNAIAQHTGYLNYFRQFLSEIGEISWSKGEKYQSFLMGELDSSKRFLFLYNDHDFLFLTQSKSFFVRNRRRPAFCT